jgi:hypothetical protein
VACPHCGSFVWGPWERHWLLCAARQSGALGDGGDLESPLGAEVEGPPLESAASVWLRPALARQFHVIAVPDITW